MNAENLDADTQPRERSARSKCKLRKTERDMGKPLVQARYVENDGESRTKSIVQNHLLSTETN